MSAPVLPADVAANPRLSQWIRVAADGTLEVFAGKVELGQGVAVMQLQIAADELEVPLSQVSLRLGDTACCPDQGATAGSLSTEVGGMALRHVCADVRQRFIEAAAGRLGVEPEHVQLRDGLFRVAGQAASLGYADLARDVELDQPARPDARPKPVQARRFSGTNVPRPDLVAKLSGAGFIHDIEWPGMLHGRVVRPPSMQAQLLAPDPARLAAVRALPGVQALHIQGRWMGVAAEREEQAVAAAKALVEALAWDAPVTDGAGPTPDQAWLRAMDAEDSTVDLQGDEPAAGAVAQRLDASYARPYLAHASIGPSCALARWEGDRLQVCTHSQGVHMLQRELAIFFSVPTAQVTVLHADGAGCYGHNGADDCAVDAALLAQAAGRPVRLQWSREDELAWSPFGPAMSMRVRAALDAQGRIAHWRHDTWSPVHVQRPGRSQELSCLASHLRDPDAPRPPLRDFPLPAGGGQRNAVPIYALPARRIDYHLVRTPPLRSSALRALGAHGNVFAIESAMDELATLAGQDPLAFRLDHLQDRRAADVLKAVAEDAAWHTARPAPRLGDAALGRGMALARYKNTGAYCALVVQIEVTDRIVLDRVWVAVDAGEVIHPDGVVNQIEGGVIQAASWTLKEAVAWGAASGPARCWDDYPILALGEAPRQITVRLMEQPQRPPLGVGECAAGPTAAAIANALFDAVGLRARELPLSPDRLLQMLR